MTFLDESNNYFKMSYTFIDLFAGAGGLSEGFIQAGFEPIAHVEIENVLVTTNVRPTQL